jgi:hypothetical protein
VERKEERILAECTALGGLCEERRKVTETVKNNPVGTVSGGSWIEMEMESPSRRQRKSHIL